MLSEEGRELLNEANYVQVLLVEVAFIGTEILRTWAEFLFESLVQ